MGKLNYVIAAHRATTSCNNNETHDESLITMFSNKTTIGAFVYTVSCLYRPIPKLLQSFAIIFPEQL